MNTKILIVGGTILLGLVVVGSQVIKKKERNKILTSQANSEGSVEVEVIPIEISDSSDSWQFKIILNTHSVELDQDLTKATLLIDSQGNEYQPLSWDGAPPGGHHREGTLSFSRISPTPKSVTLVIRDIGGIAERNFSWEIGR